MRRLVVSSLELESGGEVNAPVCVDEPSGDQVFFVPATPLGVFAIVVHTSG
jgi:hypothetical protein